MINIITRTSGRPEAFNRCYQSVKNQTYKNINHIVLTDDIVNMSYLKKYDDIETILVDRDRLINTYDGPNYLVHGGYQFKWAPHNLYNNVGLENVSEGYYMFLDDDDLLTNSSVIETLVSQLEGEDTMLVFQMNMGGTLIPRETAMNTRSIELYNIGSPCFMVHSKWSKSVKWDAYKCGDFRYAYTLNKLIPKTKFVKLNVATITQIGDGKKLDIVNR